ncbi:unnamed protein product [Linum tenue]|uniref:RNase H type-1 domain-containing protein n=1 Tax=Linum tenue TaxID=586396 RepID=A0AAV0I8J4_9ROSI|nr:unnamed protein product [Linum tenue]
MAAARRVRGKHDQSMGEALAMELGLQLVRRHQLGTPLVEVESDCLTVVNRIREARVNYTELGTIVLNIRKLLQGEEAGRVQHTRRNANKAAHIMAHMDTRWDETEVWFDRPPISILDLLKLDDVRLTST